jgi:hypothetical protein
MHFDEYQRLSAACQTMAAQSSNHGLDKARWSRLAERCSDLADDVVARRPVEARRRLAPSHLRLSAAAYLPTRAP